MGEKLYYLVEALIFIFVGFYLYTRPEKFIKIFKRDIFTKIIGIVAFINAFTNLFKFLKFV